jgi:hypothetical protein
MKKFFSLLLFLCVGFQFSEFVAQVTPADTNLYRVVKYNNQEYIGRILNDDGREVLLETSALGNTTKQKASTITTKRYSFPVPMCTWFYKF